MERTLVIIKPGTFMRGHVGEILSRFERRGLKLIALKMYRFTPEKCAEHYAHLVDKPFYPTLELAMTCGPVVCACIEGFGAIEVVRKMAGPTNGRHAEPGTIRGDYCMSNQKNVVHASDSPEAAKVELDRFFGPEDYYEYDSPLDPCLYSPDELNA